MPPRVNSPYQNSEQVVDADGDLLMVPYDPVTYQALPDNKPYSWRDGDDWWHLAYRTYQGFAAPADLFWVITDFNGIYDITVEPETGQQFHLPSGRTILANQLAENIAQRVYY